MSHWTRREALTAIGGTAALPFAVGPARAKRKDDYVVEEVVRFSGEFELPEAITVDRRGNKYLTFPLLGEIRDVPPRSSDVSTFATGLSPVLLGIAATPPSDLYTVSTEFGGTGRRTVYRVSRDGDLYVANSDKGLVVRVPVEPDGSAGPPRYGPTTLSTSRRTSRSAPRGANRRRCSS